MVDPAPSRRSIVPSPPSSSCSPFASDSRLARKRAAPLLPDDGPRPLTFPAVSSWLVFPLPAGRGLGGRDSRHGGQAGLQHGGSAPAAQWSDDRGPPAPAYPALVISASSAERSGASSSAIRAAFTSATMISPTSIVVSP